MAEEIQPCLPGMDRYVVHQSIRNLIKWRCGDVNVHSQMLLGIELCHLFDSYVDWDSYGE
jgi:hypothetical protein